MEEDNTVVFVLENINTLRKGEKLLCVGPNIFSCRGRVLICNVQLGLFNGNAEADGIFLPNEDLLGDVLTRKGRRVPVRQVAET